MQLILDTETTIDIKRNMSTLNEETLTEKLDVIQDLKSGLCNGNKENIQSNDNTMSSDDSTLENDKSEDVVSESLTSDDGKKYAMDTEVSDKVDENVTTKDNDQEQDIASEDSFHKISEENSSVIDDPTKVVEKLSSSNGVKELKNSEKLEEIEKSVTEQSVSENDNTLSNGHECPVAIESTEEVHKMLENLEEMTKVVGKDEVSEKEETTDNTSLNGHECRLSIESIEKDRETVKSLEDITEVDRKNEVSEKEENMDNTSSNGHECELGIEAIEEIRKTVENLEEMTEVDGKDEVSEKEENMDNTSLNGHECELGIKAIEEIRETVENLEEMTEVDGKDLSEKEENTEKVIVAEKEDKSKECGIEINEMEIGGSLENDKIVEVNEKGDNNLNVKGADGKSENVNEASAQSSSNGEISVSFNEESDTASKNNVQIEALVASLETDKDENPSDPQFLNEQNVIEKSHDENDTRDDNTLNVQSNIDEIETVNLDDEEKETGNSEANIVNTDVELNSQIKINNVSDCPNINKEKSESEMETVDLVDEEDFSEPEAMDVDTNGETGEVESNDQLVCKSSQKDNVLTLDCEDDRGTEENSEKICLENNVTPMDEDSHPVESSDKSVVSKETENEKVSTDAINILLDGNDDMKKEVETAKELPKTDGQQTKVTNELKKVPSVLKLSNTLDILSDDEDEVKESQKTEPQPESKVVEKDVDKKCISIDDDDDDIMLVYDDDVDDKDTQNKPALQTEVSETNPILNSETKETTVEESESEIAEKVTGKDTLKEEQMIKPEVVQEERGINEDKKERTISEVKPELPKPLVPNDFLKTCKKNMAEMTRDDLEEFCILKIVESVVDRSSLSEIKTKLKSMAQSIEEYKKKAMMLTKQNRDLQVVLKTIQEEQKNSKIVTPLKITRSVGMQVLMTERANIRRKPPGPTLNVNNNTTPSKSPRATNQRPIKVPAAPSPQQIPVPRLVPASNSPATKTNMTQITNTGKSSPVNGVRNNQQKAEKRGAPRNQSVTVDLTDDEPPAKVNRNSTPAPVRVVAPHMVPQNMLATTSRHPIAQNINNPRKVYIPISGPQNPQNVRPGQAIMLKSVSPSQSPRPRVPQPHTSRLPQNQIRMARVHNRHPAPLPESNKIYSGSHLKAVPPAPDLKLSKVENGIVISWKIDGYQEDSYEEIASYQLYAYQETSVPPSTTLWKKIGNVKALPLPMACTLTQFMAGFKYFFAVRAVDIHSRIGPFSAPGSILLLNRL